MRKYVTRIGIALSVLINVILGGASNQTFSARNYQWKRDGRFNICWLLDRIFWYDTEHCCTSWVYWRVRREINHGGKYRL